MDKIELLIEKTLKVKSLNTYSYRLHVSNNEKMASVVIPITEAQADELSQLEIKIM